MAVLTLSRACIPPSLQMLLHKPVFTKWDRDPLKQINCFSLVLCIMIISKPELVSPSAMQLPSHPTVLALCLQLCLVPTSHLCTAHPARPASLVALWHRCRGTCGRLAHGSASHWATSPSVASARSGTGQGAQGPLAPSPTELLPQSLEVAGSSWCPEQSQKHSHAPRMTSDTVLPSPDVGGPRTIWTRGSIGTLGLGHVRTMAVLSGIQRW